MMMHMRHCLCMRLCINMCMRMCMCMCMCVCVCMCMDALMWMLLCMREIDSFRIHTSGDGIMLLITYIEC